MSWGPRTLSSLCKPHVKQDILNRFIQRFTMDYMPVWAMKQRDDGSYYAPQFASDAEWLSNTIVNTRKDGELDERQSHCKTDGQTWPLGQSLDKPFAKCFGPVKR